MEEYVVEQIIKLDTKLEKFEKTIIDTKQRMIFKTQDNLKFSAVTNQFQTTKVSRKELKNLEKSLRKLENTKKDLTFACDGYFKLYSETELEDWNQKQIHKYVKRYIAQKKRTPRRRRENQWQ